jgi:hypothetical protein
VQPLDVLGGDAAHGAENDGREKGESGKRAARLHGYFDVITKWERRFCCQQSSDDSVQKGRSLPYETVRTRPPDTPSDSR